MTSNQGAIDVMRLAQLNLDTLKQCIDYLNERNANSALRSIAIRLEVLSFRAGGATADAGIIARKE